VEAAPKVVKKDLEKAEAEKLLALLKGVFRSSISHPQFVSYLRSVLCCRCSSCQLSCAFVHRFSGQ
jgi:hypothetical protein